MSNDNVLALRKPEVSHEVRDALTDVLRDGARRLLAQAVEAEVTEFLVRYEGEQDAAGRMRMVRNGHLPERTIQTGLGQVSVKAPRVHDRRGEVRFSSTIVPRYLRRARTIEEWLPWLYLKGSLLDGRESVVRTAMRATSTIVGFGGLISPTLDGTSRDANDSACFRQTSAGGLRLGDCAARRCRRPRPCRSSPLFFLEREE